MELDRAPDFFPALHNFHIPFTVTAKEDWIGTRKTQRSLRFIHLIARSVC